MSQSEAWPRSGNWFVPGSGIRGHSDHRTKRRILEEEYCDSRERQRKNILIHHFDYHRNNVITDEIIREEYY